MGRGDILYGLDDEDLEREPKKDPMDNLVRIVASIAAILTVLAPQFGLQYGGRIWIVICLQCLLVGAILKNELIALVKWIFGLIDRRSKRRQFDLMRKRVCVLLDEYARWTTSNSYQSLVSVVPSNNHSDPLSKRMIEFLRQDVLRMARTGLLTSKDPFVAIACAHTAFHNVHIFVRELWREVPTVQKESENGKQFVIHYNEIIKKLQATFENVPYVEFLGDYYMDSRRVASVEPKKLQGYYFQDQFEFLV